MRTRLWVLKSVNAAVWVIKRVYSTRHHGISSCARGKGGPQTAHLWARDPLFPGTGAAAAAARRLPAPWSSGRCAGRLCGRWLGGLALAILPQCCVFAVGFGFGVGVGVGLGPGVGVGVGVAAAIVGGGGGGGGGAGCFPGGVALDDFWPCQGRDRWW
jgi:hypothetical protein